MCIAAPFVRGYDTASATEKQVDAGRREKRGKAYEREEKMGSPPWKGMGLMVYIAFGLSQLNKPERPLL